LLGVHGLDASEVRNAVVWFMPRAGTQVTPPAEPFEIITVKKDFVPRTLAVPLGSKVKFPNQDPILHNVFSVSGSNSFDLGLYRQGQARAASFDHAGVVRVFCNVHHDMVAYVVVLETPYFTSPDAEGRFRLADLPAGPGTLTVWHERSELVSQDVEVPANRPLDIGLEVTKARIPPHRDKTGKPYSRNRRGRGYR